MNLTSKKCVPCEGGTPPFGEEKIKEYLPELKTQWSVVNGKKLRQDFIFKNFASAVAFVNRVAEIAETEGHHPDILIHGWNKVQINLSTHAIGGLSENDFILAAKIEKLLAKTNPALISAG